jgi:hypothetical protein
VYPPLSCSVSIPARHEQQSFNYVAHYGNMLIHGCTYQYILVCTSTYLFVLYYTEAALSWREPTGILISIYHCIHVHTCTYQYELVCTSIYQYIQLPVLLTSYQYVLAFTSIYQYIQVHTSIYLYVLVCAGIYCGTLAVASHAWVVWLWRRLPCLRKLCERTKPIVLQSLGDL